MYESADIIDYVYSTYGGRDPRFVVGSGAFALSTSILASALRPGRGGSARASREPERPLELYSFEGSPFCRLARETLCELELPYLLHNVAKGSPGREAFVEISGKMMVPYLIDPNTDKAMFESADICEYLESTYAITGSGR